MPSAQNNLMTNYLLPVSLGAVILLLLIVIILVYKNREKIKWVRSRTTPLKAKPRTFESVRVSGDGYLEIRPKSLDNTRNVRSETPAPAFRINILSGIKEFMKSLWSRHKEYPANSVRGLINKEVYSESGEYIGEVKDVILRENRIDSLRIKLDRKQKFETKGIIVSYRHVKNVGEIIIIEERVCEQLSD